MIDDDFADFRSAAHESGIGHAVASTSSAVNAAIQDAVVVRSVTGRIARFHAETPETRVRWVAITLAIAAVAAFALSRAIPPYLSTFIPESGFAFAVVIFGLGAAAPHVVVAQWDHSRLRRVTRWLLD